MPANAPDNELSQPQTRHKTAQWRPLTQLDRWVLAGLVVIIVASAVPRLPPGICFDDAGELQLASTVGGPMHPPGYGGYVLAGRLLTRIPLFDPAFRVTLATMASAVTALTLLAALLTRLGLPSLIAGAFALALTWQPRVWQNLVTPEVYAPSWALLAACIYFAGRYGHTAARRDLIISGLAYGLLASNRTAAALYLPFALAAWILAVPRQPPRRRLMAGGLGALAMIPSCFLTLGYLWVADRPDAPYNYLEQFNAETHALPHAQDGIGAKATRVAWLVSGRQYSDSLRIDTKTAARQLRRLSNQIGDTRVAIPWPVERVVDLVIVAAVLLGLLFIVGSLRLWRTQAAVMVLAWGALIGGSFFVLCYDVSDQAADILPILMGGSILLGSALAVLLRDRIVGGWRLASGIVAVALSVLSLVSVPARPYSAATQRADGFARQLDLASLPPKAVLCTTWVQAPPLWYEKWVHKRSDVTIVNAFRSRWAELIADRLHQPVYCMEPASPPDGWTLAPYRNVWRLVPQQRIPAD